VILQRYEEICYFTSESRKKENNKGKFCIVVENNYLCRRNETTESKDWYSMVAAIGIRIDGATVGHAPPRGCGQCGG
jgi:hypothetical protein